MIVMGTNGAKSFGEIFLGTNAERIIRFTSIPVLVVSGQKISKPVNP
jgi:nucleotide-binding universal stress UspA family protein